MRPRERIVHKRRQLPWMRHEHVERYRFAAELVRDKVVVDCACGDGTGTRMLLEAGAAFVHAFDLSEDAIAAARALGASERASFEVADALLLPLDDRSADVYVSLETIEHLQETRAFLREVVRVLRPGGIFVCSTPNRTVYSPGHGRSSRPWNPFHVREFSVEELVELLSTCFGDVRLFGQNPRGLLRARVLELGGRMLPFDLTVRLRQAGKVPLLLLDRPERHRVLPLAADRPSEVIVAVCREPLAQSAGDA